MITLDQNDFTEEVSKDCLESIANLLGFKFTVDNTDSEFLSYSFKATIKTASEKDQVGFQESESLKIYRYFKKPKEMLEVLFSSRIFMFPEIMYPFGPQYRTKTNPFFNISTLTEFKNKLDHMLDLAYKHHISFKD